MSWYSTGTVSVTNGATLVTGTGTGWFGALQNGWGFVGPDGRLYEIESITDAASLTLGTAYQGATASPQAYAIFPTNSLDIALVASVQSLITNYQSIYDGAGQGKFPDGTLGAPGWRFFADLDSGARRIGDNNWALVAGGADIIKLFTDRAEMLALENTPIGQTTPAAASFSAVNVVGPSPVMDLSNSDDPASHQRTRFLRWTDVFRMATRDSTGASVSIDYEMRLGALGATSHSWRVEGVEGLKMTSDGLGVGVAPIAGSAITVKSDSAAHLALRRHSSDGVVQLSLDPSRNGVGSRDASIRSVQDGTTQVGMSFFTSSAATPVERLRVRYDGHIHPGVDDVQSLGTASFRWDDFYATNTAIQSSDERLKHGIRVLNDAEKRVAASLKTSNRIYQWKDAVEAKGEDAARLHCGFIAQDVEAAFVAEGLDAGRYSLFTRTPVTKTVIKTREVERQVTETITSDVMEIEVVDGVAVQTLVSKTVKQGVMADIPLVDEDGTKIGTHCIPVMEIVTEEYAVEEPDGDRLGLRYAELMCFLMAAS